MPLSLNRSCLNNEINLNLQVVMAAGEVEHAAYRLMVSLGRGDEWDPEEFDSVVRVIHAFKFGIFLTVLESKYTR